jgi:glycosyltransferase involved in cell wall biosynthesis
LPAGADIRDDTPVSKRIAIVLPDLRGGGAERLNLDLAHEIARRGYAVEFVVMRAAGELLDEARLAFEIVELNATRLRNVPFALAAYLRHRKPDALLTAMWPLTGAAVVAKRLSNYRGRLVVSEHNTLSLTPAYRGWSKRVHRRLGRWLYDQADAVVCVSQGVSDDLAHATGLSRERLHVIYNPIRRPPAEASPPDPGIWSWWSASDARLLSIGSLKAQKDQATLLRALARLRRERSARLLLLGEGELRPELATLAASLGLNEAVLMPGFVPDPYPYLSKADLFVLSSAWEGLGNVITEALAAGTPVVSTDCRSGPAELLEHGRYGKLTPVGDVDALARAIEEALEAPVDREQLKARAAEFYVERAADQYLALLDPYGSAAGEP